MPVNSTNSNESDSQIVSHLSADELRYQLFREYICHEDLLINHRLTWLLVSEGLIFSAYSALARVVVTINLEGNAPDPNHIQHQLFILEKIESVLKFSGLLIGIATLLGILACFLSINSIENGYREKPEKLPDLTGGGNPWAQILGAVSPLLFPLILSLAWAFILLPTKEILLFIRMAVYGI